MNPLVNHEQSLIRNGFASFWGGFAQQNPLAFVSWNRFLNAHNVDNIIEIGTHTAGLSLMFALYAHNSRMPASCDDPNEPSLFVNRTHHKSPKTFTTYDIAIRDKGAILTLRHLGAQFIKADTLTDQATIDLIRGQIAHPGTTLLLCDGGCKKRELDLYGSALKSGDFVGLHDWAKDEVAFERNKREGIWQHWETRMTDGEGEGQQFGIDKLLERDGIEQVYEDEFSPVAWFVGRKL